jgi:hypothetical protein
MVDGVHLTTLLSSTTIRTWLDRTEEFTVVYCHGSGRSASTRNAVACVQTILFIGFSIGRVLH